MESNVQALKGKIENIIFDFGGVLLDLYPERTFDSLSNLIGINFGQDMMPDKLMDVFIEYEIGLSRDEKILWNIQNLAGNKKPTPREIIDAWNAMLGGWQQSKLDLLLKANAYFDIYLLSNTNHMHLDWVYRDLKMNHGIEDFDQRFFKKTYYSHLIGMRKPNADIFEYVINESNLLPAETLFIDDNYENVVAAQTVGLNAIHHARNSSLDYIFDLIN